jgi:peptidoglycan/LPS O-acetylase OafA/YrhL
MPALRCLPVRSAPATSIARDRDLAAWAPNLAPPPGNPRFAPFDGLRAVAALSVFVGHTVTGTYGFTQDPTRFRLAVQLAYQGVAIFFLISGFLLYRPFLVARRRGERFALGAYIRRRVLRIVPAYWVALSVFLLLGVAPGVTTGNWWVFYAFGQIYDPQLIGRGIGVAWTLCIEMSFYVALPVFVFAAARLSRRRDSVAADITLLGLLFAGSILFRAHFHAFLDTAKVSTLPGTFSWFALGMAAAILSVRAGDGGRWSAVARGLGARASWFWPAAAALSVGPFLLMRGSPTTGAQLGLHVLEGVIALLILLPAAFGDRGRLQRVLGSRTAVAAGVISYAFYLYHSAIIAQLVSLAQDSELPARYPFVLIAALVLSGLCASTSFYLLERPLLNLGRRRAAMPAPRAPGDLTTPSSEPVGSAPG